MRTAADACKECYEGDHDNCSEGTCRCPVCYVDEDAFDADELGIDPNDDEWIDPNDDE